MSTFVLEQDIGDGSIIDAHVKAGTVLDALIKKTVINLLKVPKTVPSGSTSVRLDLELQAEVQSTGTGVIGLVTTTNHEIFQQGKEDALLNNNGWKIYGQFAYAVGTAPFVVTATFTSTSYLYTGIAPASILVGDLIKLTDGVTTFLDARVVTNTPSGPTSGTLVLDAPFGAATGPYIGYRMARWQLNFIDSETAGPWALEEDGFFDLGIRKRVSLAFEPEPDLPPPGFLPDADGGVPDNFFSLIELILDPGETFIWFHGLDFDIPLMTWWVEWPIYPTVRYFFGMQASPSGPFFSHVGSGIPTLEGTFPVDFQHLDGNSTLITNRNSVIHRVKGIVMRP